jgi:hypothetical protein
LRAVQIVLALTTCANRRSGRGARSLSLALVDEVGPVVLADGRRGVLAHRVEESCGVGLGSELADVCFVSPAESGYLVIGGELAAGDLTAEDQGDDAAGHVLVDAGERVGLDVESGLFADLAAPEMSGDATRR